MRVDEAGQDSRLAQVDHLSSSRNPDLRLGPDVSDALAEHKHHLPRQHSAGIAVEQPADANRDRSRRRRALQHSALRSHAGPGTRESPGIGSLLARRRRRSLRVEEGRQQHRAKACSQYGLLVNHESSCVDLGELGMPARLFSLMPQSMGRIRRRAAQRERHAVVAGMVDGFQRYLAPGGSMAPSCAFSSARAPERMPSMPRLPSWHAYS